MHKGLFLFFTLFLIISGCYTVIKHPAVVEEENPEFSHAVYFNDDCASCHDANQMALNSRDEQPLPRLNYIQGNDRWNYYYSSPWWLNDRFYHGSGSPAGASSGGNAPLPTTSARPRFPGNSGSSANMPSTTRISGGSSSGSSSNRVTGNNTPGDSSSGPAVRGQSSGSSGARKATRGSGNSDSKSSKKVNRRKQK